MTDDQREAYEERAAILEFDADISREEAEKAALAMVTADAERNGKRKYCQDVQQVA